MSDLIKEKEFKNISVDTENKLLSSTIEILKGNQNQIIGIGSEGMVYKIEVNESETFAMKISHLLEKNPETGENQRTFCKFDNEIKYLKKVLPLGSNFQKYIGKIELWDKRTILITSFIKGEEFNSTKENLNEKDLEKLLNILFLLDKNNILHFDLKTENIKINNDGEICILDFGQSTDFDIINFEKNVNSFNFPEFECPSNLRNFEDTFLSPYLSELSKRDKGKALNLFISYLKIKSKFHENRANYLKEYLIQNNPNTINSDIECKINHMIKYEIILSNVFKDFENDEDVLKIELLKNDITFSSELAYKNEILLLNPLGNTSLKLYGVILAKKLEILTDTKQKNDLNENKKKYYHYKNLEAEFRKKRIANWSKYVANELIDSLVYDSNEKSQYEKKYFSIIDQCLSQNNLTNFEYPNLHNDLLKK